MNDDGGGARGPGIDGAPEERLAHAWAGSETDGLDLRRGERACDAPRAEPRKERRVREVHHHADAEDVLGSTSREGDPASDAGRGDGGDASEEDPAVHEVSRRACSPHSVFAEPAQRPARSSSPSATARVQGAQPIER
jgi:hypothetical protein